MMKDELWRYSRRQLANVLSISGDEQFRSTLLMLKIMEMNLNDKLASISESLHPCLGVGWSSTETLN